MPHTSQIKPGEAVTKQLSVFNSVVCRSAAIDWAPLKSAMRENGRYHVETY
jgi:hypothetical protein